MDDEILVNIHILLCVVVRGVCPREVLPLIMCVPVHYALSLSLSLSLCVPVHYVLCVCV